MITLQERVHSSPPPSNWNLNKLHRVFRVRKGHKNLGMREDNLLSLSYGRIINKDIDTADGLLPESFETYQIVEPGNIVMRLTDLQNDKRSLRQGLVKERGIITSAYDALELERGHDPRFWAYALLALDLAKYYYSLGAGVRQSIKFADFPNDWIATPNENTQEAIANFLDRETTRIDKLIEKKKRLVVLVDQRRRSEITTEVLGLSRKFTKRKPSRSSFIGDIPVDWGDAQLKHLVRPGTSITYGIVQAGPEYEGGIPYIRTGDMKGDELPVSGYPNTSPEIERSYVRSRMEKGDLVIAIRATVGKCLRLPDELIGANLTQGTAKVSPGPKVNRDFMFYSILSAPSQAFFEESSKGATFKEITLDRLRRLVLPLPPREQQEIIAAKLNRSEERFRALKVAAQKSVERLHEFRSALITAAVSGQIDVETWGNDGTTDRRLDQIEEDMALREARA